MTVVARQRRRRRLGDLETGDQFEKCIGFLGQRMAGGGRFLDHGGVLLGRLVHVDHGRVDLGDVGRLFPCRIDNLGDVVVDVLDLLADGTLPQAGFVRQEEIDLPAFLANREQPKAIKPVSGPLTA